MLSGEKGRGFVKKKPYSSNFFYMVSWFLMRYHFRLFFFIKAILETPWEKKKDRLEVKSIFIIETMPVLTRWLAATYAFFEACHLSRPPPCPLQLALWSVRFSMSLRKGHGIRTAAKHTKGELTSLTPSYRQKYMTQNENLRLVLWVIIPDARKFKHLCNLSQNTS